MISDTPIRVISFFSRNVLQIVNVATINGCIHRVRDEEIKNLGCKLTQGPTALPSTGNVFINR